MPGHAALTLLVAKASLTAVAAASGLVGGTFALALFLGGMLGAAFQHGVIHVADGLHLLNQPLMDAEGISHGLFQPTFFEATNLAPSLPIGDVPTFAMVGAASVLSAMFQAPLTACLLLLEITRSYDAVLPILASAGVANIVGEHLKEQFDMTQLNTDTTTQEEDDIRIVDAEIVPEMKWDVLEEEPELPRSGLDDVLLQES